MRQAIEAQILYVWSASRLRAGPGGGTVGNSLERGAPTCALRLAGGTNLHCATLMEHAALSAIGLN